MRSNTKQNYSKVEIHSICAVRFCPHKNVCTYNYTLKMHVKHCVRKMRICEYKIFSIMTEKRKRFRMHAKTQENG